MTNSIPASALISVDPNVLAAGGNGLTLNAVMATQDTSIPLGTVAPFASFADVSAWFGPNAPETALADIYFQGFTNAEQLPGNLFFVQFNTSAVSAYVRGASVGALTLAQLQALSGTVIVTVDGGPQQNSGSVNLSAATSFSDAATIITAAFASTGSFAGTASQTASTDEMVVTAVSTGFLDAGAVIAGTGVDEGLTVVNQVLPLTTGETLGGVGRYIVSTTTGFASTAITAVPVTATVTYDTQRAAFEIVSPTTGTTSSVSAVTGTLAALLYLTTAKGAVSSAGAVATTPAALLGVVTGATQNFATFMTVTEQALDVKLAFAAAFQTYLSGKRYAYVVQDSDATALSTDASGSFGVLTAEYNGIVPVYDTTGGTLAAFICGVTASIDFTATNGRITYAYKGLGALVPQITDETTANNLEANGYNFYAQYATAAEEFQMLQPGLVSGSYDFLDAFINQVQMSNAFQLALMVLATTVKSIPYNNAGYTLIRSTLIPVVQASLNFGSIQPGVELSAQQAAEVNTAAGVSIDGTLSTRGWYLQVLPASAQVRQQRGSPPINFWYTDGGSIQQIQLNSTDVQ